MATRRFPSPLIKVRFLGGMPVIISLSVSGYATSFGARISWVRVPQERPKVMRGSFNGKITGFHPVVEGSIPSPRTKFRISSANIINFLLSRN